MRLKIIYFSAVVLGLILLSVHHLGSSVGDDLLRWIGISPWTKGDDTGFHWTVVLFGALLIIGTRGIAKIYRPRYPKIMSRLIIGYIIFIVIFPYITEQLFFLTKFNSSGISSVAYSKKESQCDYSSEDNRVKAMCTLNIYNYGKLRQVSLRPTDLGRLTSSVEFQPKVINVRPRSQTTVIEEFYGEQVEHASSQGWSRTIGVEIEVNGYKKTFK